MKRTTIFALIVGALLAAMAVTTPAQTAEPKARLQIAEKMFAERCKKAGEFFGGAYLARNQKEMQICSG